MSLQYSVALRNNQLDQVEATLGVSAKLRLLTGAPPANCAAAQTGTLLCEIALPSDWMTTAAGGVKTKNGTWNGVGIASDTVAHFRVVDNAGTTCHMQGTVTLTGGGGDMTVDNTSIAINQNVTVNTFTLGAGNA